MNEERTHREIGTRSTENTRLVNQLQLQSLSPDISFFPHVVNFISFDKKNGYEVEVIEGKTLEQLIKVTDISTFLKLLLVAVEQQEKLYHSYGILIKDRNKNNFIFGKKATDDESKLYQIDVESLYDSRDDSDSLSLDADLTLRKSTSNIIRNETRTHIEIADICDSLLEIFIEYLKTKKRSELEQKIYKQLHQRLGMVRYKDFAEFKKLLAQLIAVLQ